MRLYSFILLLVSFCSFAGSDFNQSLIDAGAAIEHCNEKLKQNNKPFPTTDWFNKLSDMDKRLVVGYISLKNSENCSRNEMERLRRNSDNLPLHMNDSVDKLLEPLNMEDDISHLDMDEIKKIQANFSEPFDAFQVLDSIGVR
jgi:hypothetical protein